MGGGGGMEGCVEGELEVNFVLNLRDRVNNVFPTLI